MNEASETSAVVHLNGRLTGGTERVGELLDAVRAIANRRLQQWISNTFEHVDDALFDLAEKAENNAAQMHYFDGMREVRKRRPAVERAFLNAINRELGNLSHAKDAPPSPAGTGGPVELSLVADNELEEALAITSMIGKNEARLSRDLYAVNQRLSVICGGRKIDDASNPMAPAILSQAFRDAMHELSADMRVKLIIYKLFDRYLLSALESLYQDVNADLVRAGVLPQLRHRSVRGTSTSSTNTPQVGSSAGADMPVLDDAGEFPDNLVQTLHALFSARRVANGSAALGEDSHLRAGSAPLPSANELLGALSVLQSQIASGGVLHPDGGDNATALGNEVLQLKAQLLNQVGALRGEHATRVATIDEDTIDLVGMLFEFILEDRTLPAEMQAVLGRLQIPYLKAAILDRKLFAHRQHPARRLLDSMAEQAKGWSQDSDRDPRLYDKIKSIVEQLLHDFDDDMGIFERLLADLQAFQDTSKRRSEVAEQRVAESTRGREKLDLARRRAAREILERIGSEHLPPLVHGILARAWANHLVLTLLRQGDDSPEFKAALRFVDEFIASTRPAPDHESRQLLRRMLPGIERALRHGLGNVAFQAQDIDRLLAQLHAYYRQQLGETVDPVELSAVDNEDASMLAMPDSTVPVTEDEHAVAAEVDEVADVAVDSPQLKQVESLQPGTWLEFSFADQSMARAKLSWISPMSGRYLFVNRRGLKVGDYAPHELAQLLVDGSARVLPASALFDRAMNAIVGRLSEEAPAAGSATAEAAGTAPGTQAPPQA
ncbi:MAG: DUF1631 domain-containing protein [Rhodanobacter sp.]